MLIDKDWVIEADSLNIILRKRVKRKKDSVYIWPITGYFSDVKNALHELVEQKIRQTKLADLQSITKAIEELHKIIDGLPAEVNCKALQPLSEASKPVVSRKPYPLVKKAS